MGPGDVLLLLSALEGGWPHSIGRSVSTCSCQGSNTCLQGNAALL